jgi:hypothetical protein
MAQSSPLSCLAFFTLFLKNYPVIIIKILKKIKVFIFFPDKLTKRALIKKGRVKRLENFVGKQTINFKTG